MSSISIIEKWQPAPDSPMARMEAKRVEAAEELIRLREVHEETMRKMAAAREIISRTGAYTDPQRLAEAMGLLPALVSIYNAQLTAEERTEKELDQNTKSLDRMDRELEHFENMISSADPTRRADFQKALADARQRILGLAEPVTA